MTYFSKLSGLQIAQIKARLQRASPGPWHTVRADSPVLRPDLNYDGKPFFSTMADNGILNLNEEEILGASEWLSVEWDDLELMAHARQDIEDLLAIIEALND